MFCALASSVSTSRDCAPSCVGEGEHNASGGVKEGEHAWCVVCCGAWVTLVQWISVGTAVSLICGWMRYGCCGLFLYLRLQGDGGPRRVNGLTVAPAVALTAANSWRHVHCFTPSLALAPRPRPRPSHPPRPPRPPRPPLLRPYSARWPTGHSMRVAFGTARTPLRMSGSAMTQSSHQDSPVSGASLPKRTTKTGPGAAASVDATAASKSAKSTTRTIFIAARR